MKKIIALLFFFISYIGVYPQYFKTDNTTGNLLDANGNNFIMKGINVPLSWYQTQVNGSIAALRTNTGSNCLRIVVNAGYNGTTATPTNVWQNCVQLCIDNKMIPMVELHDWTGSTNTTNDFTNMANWFVTHADYFKKPEIARYILLNICNEWGTWQTANSNGAAWRDGFNQAVTLIRNAGIKSTLVIDAVGYGQDIDDAKNIRAYAASMINSDPEKNLLFSIHMYCEWKKGGDDIPGTLKWARDNKIPLIVGEFGYQHATDGSCDIDEQLIMDECQAKGIGWLAWSQKGNGGGVEYLDLCGDWDCRASTLSNWGKTVFDGRNGTKTAVTASVFTTAPNVPPTVSLTAPTNNATFNALSSITISANATDTDGTISRVEFYAGTDLIATDNTSPYSINWTNVPAGTYSITAVAYDNANGKTTSTARTIIVNQPTNNTPPSCVITHPHVNAYFKSGSSINFRVYSTDIGGTYTNGTVSKVEFFYAPVATPNAITKLGEKTTHTSNTYEYIWENVPVGSYRLTARATDNSGGTFTSAGVTITIGTSAAPSRGLSACKGKYLANIIANSVRTDFGTYWNGVTAENSCKWGSVEATKDVMNWIQADIAYNYANTNNLMFRYHTLAWGSQYPQWIEALSTNVTEFRKQMEEYMAAIAARYPNIDQIDVLNENMYINTYNKQEHAAGTPYFRAGLGGPGVTGYDWAIWLFEKARQYFPNSKLVMNDFELENNTAGINEMLAVVKVLRDRGLIDGFGTQAHCFNVDGLVNQPNTLKSSIDLMATSGIPVYVTELDLNGGSTPSEASQLASYQNLFPVYWNHPAVAGITLWGYVEGQTWKAGTGLLNADGSKRSAMTWLENYMAGRSDVGYPFCGSGGIIVPPTNMLTNGEFDLGTSGWTLQNNGGAQGVMT
ncbi:MAG: endo-1,4-beta-xylanase, partial [Bacteroidales bacterium]